MVLGARTASRAASLVQNPHIGTFAGPAGTFRQRTDVPKMARNLLAALKIDAPRKIYELTTPAA